LYAPQIKLQKTRNPEIMKTGPLSLFRRALSKAPQVHPIDRKHAKHWIKKRLLAVFPELHNDPRGLEEAYQALDLAPRFGREAGEPHSYFDLKLPEK
jgi:hypothetical protein